MSRAGEITGYIIGALFAIAVFVLILAWVKTGVDNVSFVDALKDIFSITATAEVDPELPEDTEEVVETVAQMLK